MTNLKTSTNTHRLAYQRETISRHKAQDIRQDETILKTQDKTKQYSRHKTRQKKTRYDKTPQHKTRQDTPQDTTPDKATQRKTQEKFMEDRTRQKKTGQSQDNHKTRPKTEVCDGRRNQQAE
jgi:hypothetical protein